jgi:hypothetical protein
MLIPDLAQSTAFLDFLEPGGLFTFQTFADRPALSIYPSVMHGTLDEHAAELMSLNQRGAGIFVMDNAGDGVIRPGAKTCRTQANVTRVRALFVDLDGAPLEPVTTFEEPPDLVVETSPGRWHAYWQVDDCELDEFSHLQQCLAAEFEGDRSVCDLPRVMRLPGFWHVKSETPFLSHLVESDSAKFEGPHGA